MTMPHFFCKLTAPRPTFAFDMNESEKALMGEHAQYWLDMLKEDVVLVFGPVMDPNGPFGMGIMEGADETEVRHRTDADPVMKAGIGFEVEIMPMRAITRAACA
jgi:uncharacterized protein YciI